MFTQKPLHYHEIANDASAAAVPRPSATSTAMSPPTAILPALRLRRGGVTMEGQIRRATTGPGGCDVCGGGGRSN
uniref:Uncharacterized protein n=1 Tax=Oryza sativa subsp. japonica TaxID=39947 RepID=Q69T20_ORYSJ|nr:hypothetical protein [Oryza sativa Japonica Group]BAD35912.1 hypothetical protein [Oryza sativa Japonica Group]